MRMLVVGDVMPGGILAYQNQYWEGEMKSYFNHWDLRIGTLECAIGDNYPYDKEKTATTNAIVFCKEAEALKLVKMGFNVLSLANNHVTDLGIDGLKNTIRFLEKHNIDYCGAGMNIEEAKKPVIIKTRSGQTLAIIGCLFKEKAPMIFHAADDNKAGVYQTTIEELEAYVRQLKQTYDYVFCMPHWAEEHKYLPPLYCKEYAKRLAKAGADAIFGDHTHLINPVTKEDGIPCFYSLGNFLFPDMVLTPPRPMFYPNQNELKDITNRVWSYPKRINVPSIAVWKQRNRIGMVAEIDLGKTIRHGYSLVYLNEKNILQRLTNFDTTIKKFKLKVLGLCLKMPFYDKIRLVYILKQGVFKKLGGKLLNKLKK